MHRYLLLCTFFLFLVLTTKGQNYVEKQNRHRFAQLTLGLDYQIGLGRAQSYYETENRLTAFDLDPIGRGRFLLGGTHFWGHADFYIAIPLWSGSQQTDFAEVFQGPGVETVFKYYPWRIQRKRIAPYLGIGLTPFGFRQDALVMGEFSSRGADITRVRYPMYMGLTALLGNHLFELGAVWNYDNDVNYYINPNQSAGINMHPWNVSLGYKYMLDTTQGAEKSWDNGNVAIVTERKKKDGSLNDFFIGFGLSSAWFLRKSDYLEENYPWIDDHKIAAPFPDVVFGYLWNPPDIHLNAVFRTYRSSLSAHGTVQRLQRRSLGLEAIKTLGDYHGFVPFIGPVVSYEWVNGSLTEGEQTIWDESQGSFQAGVTFGWDIRPTHLDWFFLRTNLRYFPAFDFKLDTESIIPLDQIEFNFIQMVVYLNRAAKNFKRE